MRISFMNSTKDVYNKKVNKVVSKQQESKLKASQKPKYKTPMLYWQASTQHYLHLLGKIVIRLFAISIIWSLNSELANNIYRYSAQVSALKQTTTSIVTQNSENLNIANFSTIISAILIAMIIYSFTKIKYCFSSRKDYYANLDLSKWTQPDETPDTKKDAKPVKERHSRHVKKSR